MKRRDFGKRLAGVAAALFAGFQKKPDTVKIKMPVQRPGELAHLETIKYTMDPPGPDRVWWDVPVRESEAFPPPYLIDPEKWRALDMGKQPAWFDSVARQSYDAQ